MRILIGLTTLLLLLTACSSKTDDPLKQRFEKNKTTYKHLQKTEKVQLYDHNITKVFLTATYLYARSNKLKKEKKDEQFVVGVYIEEDQFNQLGKEYNLTLEGEKPKSIQPLSKQSPYLEGIPFVTEWNSYYLVTFPHTVSKKFTLLFESRKYGQKEMPFSKAAKYVENTKAF
ncbi:hypothetical protein PGH07_06350 [Sulfurovum sp. zt1-1]|uniref:Lipoprotein n=1 Tax=Sulfurovum zhangzhouensis TaxID=3019067 RepID=A0ABT7QZW6_9BACT|nr:hypothetical protein [Sulfurovum zhangzhouensis]MDM5271791.1 hypothetical protein [Sulfurovum zhangzhouensis]